MVIVDFPLSFPQCQRLHNRSDKWLSMVFETDFHDIKYPSGGQLVVYHI